jgi:glyoxylate reductase
MSVGRFLVFTDSAEIAGVYGEHLPEGWVIEHLDDRNDTAERREKLARADAMLHADVALDGDELRHATRLKLIQRQGVGYDNLDVEAAADRGIAVCLCPIGTPEAVAEHTVLLAMAVARHLPEVQRDVAQGAWPKWTYRDRSVGLDGTRVTIVGFGRIGQAVAERLLPFGAQLTVVVRPGRTLDPSWHARGVVATHDLDAALPTTEILTLHCPLSDDTRGMIDGRRLARLPAGAILVNTSRGDLVIEEDLVDALRRGHLTGAGLDVLSEEPPPKDHPLRTLPNVVLTSHLAAGTRTTQRRKAEVVMSNAKAVLEGREPRFRLV